MLRLRGRAPFVAVLAASVAALCVGLVLALPAAMPADVGWVAYAPRGSGATIAGAHMLLLSTRTVIGLLLIVVALVAAGGLGGFALGRRARVRPDRAASDPVEPPRP
jgi:hypothetical protein